MKIDLTPVFQSIIALLAALVTYKLIPFIRSKVTEQQFSNLEAAARVAVYAAEQIFKSGDNAAKLDYAVNQVLEAGFDLNVDTIRAAVEQAVYGMKSEKQLVESIKNRASDGGTEDEDEDDDGYHIPPLEDWPLEMIETFCDDNGIPHSGCASKDDYIRAITENSQTHPPEDATQDID